MAIDVEDATFETEVLDRSEQVPVIVDLWAPWCGPCRTLGPILEKVVGETDGKAVLVKVNVDENPQLHTAFRVQSIPAVYAVKDRAVVNGFIGAVPEATARQFVQELLPTEEESEVERLLAKGDLDALQQALVLDPDNEQVIVALGEALVADGRPQEALDLLARIPESPATRHVAALARSGGSVADDDVETKLEALLGQVKDDEAARQEFLDRLELLGPDDPRTPDYRKRLTAQLF